MKLLKPNAGDQCRIDDKWETAAYLALEAEQVALLRASRLRLRRLPPGAR